MLSRRAPEAQSPLREVSQTLAPLSHSTYSLYKFDYYYYYCYDSVISFGKGNVNVPHFSSSIDSFLIGSIRYSCGFTEECGR